MKISEQLARRDFLKLTGCGVAGALQFPRLGKSAAPVFQGLENKAVTRPSRPNVLVVMADQWRRFALGFMKADPVNTPNLDAFAAEGMVFTRAYCSAAVCTPARGSIITGRFPQTTGIINNGSALRKSEVTIAQAFKAGGYTTGYIGKWHIAGRPPGKSVMPDERGGFEYWCGNNCSHDNYQMHHTTGVDTPITMQGYVPDLETDYAIKFLQKKKDKPFLLFVSWAPPHPGTSAPGLEVAGGNEDESSDKSKVYAAPKEYTTPYKNAVLHRPNVSTDFNASKHVKNLFSDPAVPPIAGYFGAITALDKNFGKLMRTLDETGLRANTVVVFTSDHGEMMMSHGLFGKHVWWEESISVPFIVRWPQEVPVGTCDVLFNQPDIMPTLLGLADITIPKTVEGTDFSPALRGQPMEGPAETYVAIFNERDAAGSNGEGWRCIRTKKYMYTVEVPKTQKAKKGKKSSENGGGPAGITKLLFDTEKDPYQMKPIDVSHSDNSIANELGEKLRGWLEQHHDPFAKLI